MDEFHLEDFLCDFELARTKWCKRMRWRHLHLFYPNRCFAAHA